MPKPNVSPWAPLPKGTATQIAEAAKAMEAKGYAGAIANQVYRPPWAALAISAAQTTELGLEAGIAMAFVRSPFETACAALELDRLSEGRFTLGLGTAPGPWTEQYFGEEFSPPVGRLREVIDIIRLVNDAAIDGAPSLPCYEGDHYQVSCEGLVPTYRWIAAQVEPATRSATIAAE